MTPFLVQQRSHHSELNVPMVGDNCNELNVPTVGSIYLDGHKMLFTSVMDYVTTLFSKKPQDGCGCCGCSPCCC